MGEKRPLGEPTTPHIISVGKQYEGDWSWIREEGGESVFIWEEPGVSLIYRRAWETVVTIARKSQEVGGGSLFFLSPPSLVPILLSVFPLNLHLLFPGYGTFVHHVSGSILFFSSSSSISSPVLFLSVAAANWKGAQVPGQAPPCDGHSASSWA